MRAEDWRNEALADLYDKLEATNDKMERLVSEVKELKSDKLELEEKVRRMDTQVQSNTQAYNCESSNTPSVAKN